MPQRLWAIASVSCGSVLYTLDGGIPGVALPIISERLGIASSSAVLLVSAYNLVLAMALLPLAAVGERLGLRRVFIAGLGIYVVAGIGCLFSNSLPFLLVFRALQALAGGSLLSVSLALVRMVYPPNMLGRGLGFNTMAASLGAAIAPPLGGLIVAHLPWQTVFAAGMPLALLGLLTCRALPDPEPHAKAYDSKGAMLCAVTFGLLIAGMQMLGEGSPAALIWPTVTAGLVAAVLFVRHEHRIAHPVLPIDLLKQSAIALSVFGALMAVLSSTLMLLYLPFHLHEIGFGSAEVGAMIAPYAVTVMIAAPSSGMLSDRIPAVKLGLIGMAIASIGLLSLLWLPVAPQFFDVAWRVAICGLGFSLFFSPNGRMVVGSVPRARAAGASSLLATTRMFGQALGSTSLAALLGISFLNFGPPPLVAAAALALMGLLCGTVRVFIRVPEQ